MTPRVVGLISLHQCVSSLSCYNNHLPILLCSHTAITLTQGGLYLDVNRPLRLDWSHRQRGEIPWYCTSPTEAVPKTWNTSRCLVVPKNVRVPAIINQHRGPNLPCPQFKPIPESKSLAWALDAASWIPGEEVNFHTTAPWDIKHITRKIWISLHPSQTHNSAPLRPPPSICSPFWGVGRNERQQHRWVCTLSKQERHAAACRPLVKNAGASVMRILFFLSACKAPAIILILSSPEGSYYSIYNNSPGLLHFVHTGQRKKKTRAIRGTPAERDVLSDGTETTLMWALLYDLLTAVRSLVVWNTRARCTEADLAPVAGGSFPLAIVCHVNGCKNIIGAPSSLTGCRHSYLLPQARGWVFT